MSENARGATTRAQSLEAPAAPTQILRACGVEMHLEDFERHECTVKSSKLAPCARAVTLIYPRCSTPKCVHIVWGKLKLNSVVRSFNVLCG